MDDKDREVLATELDAELDEFIESKLSSSKGPDLNFDTSRPVDELVEELQQHPAFMKEIDLSKPMSPALEALIQLKYNPDDAAEKADNYKDDGNNNFKIKKYRWAIANYTEAIKCFSPQKEQNAILFCNRAAANFRLQNFRSAWKDCLLALKFKPDHMKAIIKGALCLMELKRFDEVLVWCDKGLEINLDEKLLLETRSKAEILKKQKERDIRKEKAQERKTEAAQKKLLETIKARGVKLAKTKGGDKKDELVLSSYETHHPSGAKVHLDDTGALNWPVLFIYPEYTQTDFIEAFNENTMFKDIVQHMFGPQAEPAAWDEDKKYTTDRLQVYFEDTERQKLLPINEECTLSDILKHDRFFVQVGTPAFIITVKESPFAAEFLKRYKS